MKHCFPPLSTMVRSWLVIALTVMNAFHFETFRNPQTNIFQNLKVRGVGEVAHRGLSDYSLIPLPNDLTYYAVVNSTGVVHILNPTKVH